MAQWKRAGLITLRSEDRNLSSLLFLFMAAGASVSLTMFTPRLGIFLKSLRTRNASLRNFSSPSPSPPSSSSSYSSSYFSTTTNSTNNNTSTTTNNTPPTPTPSSTAKPKDKAEKTKTKDEISAELLESEANLKRLKESYLISLAEQENVLQRSRRDVEAATQYAIQKFAKDIISVGDVLEMALKAEELVHSAASANGGANGSSSSNDTSKNSINSENNLHKGLQMTLEELMKVFSKHGLVQTNPLHQKFDPNLHMALFEVESEEHEVGTIISVLKRGYTLNSRLIRPAQVSVSKKK